MTHLLHDRGLLPTALHHHRELERLAEFTQALHHLAAKHDLQPQLTTRIEDAIRAWLLDQPVVPGPGPL